MEPVSKEADKIMPLINSFFVAAAFILLVVVFLTAWCLHRFKGKDGDPEPEHSSPTTKIEYITIGIPLLLVSVFLYYSITVMKELNAPRDRKEVPDVIITGHQWWWEVYYPKENITTANEIHLPAGKKLTLLFRSADVIHDWWVPELGNKTDVIPGHDTYLGLEINKSGHYEGACSEFCGQQHAWMRIKVFAESVDSFNTWAAAQQADAVMPQTALAKTGKQIFVRQTCSGCHTIGSRRQDSIDTGPDLTHLASRETLLTGLIHNDPKHLKEWLSRPQQVKPGAYMPDFHLKEQDINALTAYLTELK